MRFSKYLRTTREGKGQSQREASREVGVHKQTWSTWERGIVPRNYNTLCRIAQWVPTTLETLHSMVQDAGR